MLIGYVNNSKQFTNKSLKVLDNFFCEELLNTVDVGDNVENMVMNYAYQLFPYSKGEFKFNNKTRYSLSLKNTMP